MLLKEGVDNKKGKRKQKAHKSKLSEKYKTNLEFWLEKLAILYERSLMNLFSIY